MHLSSDPGFVTVFWPPSGLALAVVYLYGYKLLPGVFLGSLAISYFVVFLQIEGWDNLSLLKGGLSSFPPLLQVFFSVFLLKRFIGNNSHLESFKEVFVFLFVSGPLCCLISASLSTLIMALFGEITWSSFLFIWATWYVGDTLGVLVFGSVFVILLAKTERVSLRRKLFISIPLVSVFFVVITLFLFAKNFEDKKRTSDFEANAKTILKAMDTNIAAYVAELYSLRNFFRASEEVTPEEFVKFLDGVLKRNEGLQGLFWAPAMSDAELRDFEKQVQKKNNTNFFISEYLPNKGLIPVKNREIYFPILREEQSNQISSRLGFDLASTEGIYEALIDTKNIPNVFAVMPDEYLSAEKKLDFSIILPLKASKDREEFHTHPILMGLVMGSVSLRQLLERVMLDWSDKGINIRIYDAQNSVLVDTFPSNANVSKTSFSTPIYLLPLRIYGLSWFLEFHLDDEFVRRNINWSFWYALLGTSVFIFFVSCFLLVITGQTATIEKVITERTRQYREQKNFLGVIMDNIPDLIFVKNEKHQIIAANNSFLHLYPPQERGTVVGRTGLEQFKPEQQEFFLREDKFAFENGYSEAYESNTDYRGVTRTLFTRKTRFFDDQGERYVLGISRDVTELLSVQSQLESILMTMADGFMIVRSSGEIESFNRACEEIFGYSSDEAIGKHINILEFSSFNDFHSGDFLNLFAVIGFDEDILRRELFARNKQGTLFPISLAVSKVIAGKSVFFSVIVRDISKEKKVEEELRRSNKALEDFAYVASHDLKAPLRHVLLSSEFLRDRYSHALDEGATNFLNIIIKSTNRMFAMIESLLAYSGLGRRDVDMGLVSLELVMSEIIDSLAEPIARCNADISIGSLPIVYGNKNLLLQLFQNLIQNSLKYRKVGVRPNVVIGCEQVGWFWVVYIEDNGIGIDPEYKDKIFKLFQRLHGEKEFEGTGIGLAICQRIAEFHGGEITLDVEYVGGSRFIVKIPVSQL